MNFGGHNPVIGRITVCFRVQIGCSISKPEYLQGEWGRKFKPSLGILTRVKIR